MEENLDALVQKYKNNPTAANAILLANALSKFQAEETFIDNIAAFQEAETLIESRSSLDEEEALEEQVGPYTLIKKIGKGSFGEVFLAEKNSTRYALRLIPRKSLTNRLFLQNVEQSATKAMALDHHNIVKVFKVDKNEEWLYIAMEYVNGISFANAIEDLDFLEEEECIDLLKSALDALEHAHQRQVIHKNIKPSNLYICENGEIKISNFGLNIQNSFTQGATQVRAMSFGDVTAIAPEQCEGKPLDERSDIYSLGATFYYLVTGQPLFTGKNKMDIMKKHLYVEPSTPYIISHPRINKPFSNFLMTMIEKKAGRRFQSCRNALKRLEEIHGN